LHQEGAAEYKDIKYAQSFKVNNMFTGSNMRKAVQEGRAGYIPIMLHEVPLLFKRGIMPLDVAMIHVSPPDRHGYCSLGTSVDVSITAVETAKYVIAQVNPNMPRTHGDGLIHISCIDAVIECNDELPTLHKVAPDEVETKIGFNVASLIEDGATLQMGIGSIPDAVLSFLGNHKRLGIHTEMFADGVVDLVERGVITNEEKKLYRNRIITGFIMGTKRTYDFIHDNPLVQFLRIEDINDPAVIKQNPKVTAINSCIEVDLTGQVVSDSIGSKIYSGVGGQLDFIRGAALSEGGKPIIALPSTTSKGESRIVPLIKPGGGVVTTRAHVHYIVTEYGVAYLFGKNLHQRAKELIKIAHPDHREALEKHARSLLQAGWDLW
jgi:4-hydroxybutyrate CoA-transferase